MHQYIVRRLLLFIPTVWVLTLVIFLLMQIVPGDPALALLEGGGEGSFTQEDLDNLRRELGTDRPILTQYGVWIWDLVRGDMGTSYYYRTPVIDDLKNRLPVSVELAFLAMVFSFVLALPLGILSALKQDTIADYISRMISFGGIAVPNFVLGVVTVYLLVWIFNWLPALDYARPWEDLGKNLRQLVFPAMIQGTFLLAFLARVTRSSMLEVLREDYIRTARSKGLRERRILFLHALQNAFLPILTVIGWGFGISLAGSVIMEQIFVLPGMGNLLVGAITKRDYPVIQAVILSVGLMVLTLNLVVDLLYAWLDPRIRFA